MSGQTPDAEPNLHQPPHCATTDHARLPLSVLPFPSNRDQQLERGQQCPALGLPISRPAQRTPHPEGRGEQARHF